MSEILHDKMLNQAANVEAFIALVTKGNVGGEVTDSNHIHFNLTRFYMRNV